MLTSEAPANAVNRIAKWTMILRKTFTINSSEQFSQLIRWTKNSATCLWTLRTTQLYICLVMARYFVSYRISQYWGRILAPLYRDNYPSNEIDILDNSNQECCRQHVALNAVGDMDKGSLVERGEQLARRSTQLPAKWHCCCCCRMHLGAIAGQPGNGIIVCRV